MRRTLSPARSAYARGEEVPWREDTALPVALHLIQVFKRTAELFATRTPRKVQSSAT
jgi:hypothetical protein